MTAPADNGTIMRIALSGNACPEPPELLSKDEAVCAHAQVDVITVISTMKRRASMDIFLVKVVSDIIRTRTAQKIPRDS